MRQLHISELFVQIIWSVRGTHSCMSNSSISIYALYICNYMTCPVYAVRTHQFRNRWHSYGGYSSSCTQTTDQRTQRFRKAPFIWEHSCSFYLVQFKVWLTSVTYVGSCKTYVYDLWIHVKYGAYTRTSHAHIRHIHVEYYELHSHSQQHSTAFISVQANRANLESDIPWRMQWMQLKNAVDSYVYSYILFVCLCLLSNVYM